MDQSSNNGPGGNALDKNKVLEKVAPDRRSFVQRIIGMGGFAVPSVRTFLMGSAAVALVPDVYAVSNTCNVGVDIANGLQNPHFSGNPGSAPVSWISQGSPAPGFASYEPGPAQYPSGTFPTAAFSPTTFGGSGVIRQLTSITWAGGTTYTLKLWIGLPLTEPDGVTPVIGWPGANGVVRVYLTMGSGFGQVAAFDIPAPPAGSFTPYLITITLPTNSPAIGQMLGVMIYVSAPSGYSANFYITPCSVS